MTRPSKPGTVRHLATYAVAASTWAEFDAPKGATHEELKDLANNAYPMPSVCCHCSKELQVDDCIGLTSLDNEDVELEDDREMKALRRDLAVSLTALHRVASELEGIESAVTKSLIVSHCGGVVEYVRAILAKIRGGAKS